MSYWQRFGREFALFKFALCLDRIESLKNQPELVIATVASFEMLAHSLKRPIDRIAVQNALRVLVQLIEAFRASQLDFSRLLNHLQQLKNLFRG
jgi:hypothetical protein